MRRVYDHKSLEGRCRDLVEDTILTSTTETWENLQGFGKDNM
jgi:hypothetical protein